MSRGLEAFYKLIKIDEGKVLYAYSGDNFSFPYDKDIARQYDGRIEIMMTAFDEKDIDQVLKSDKYKILKDCYYAEKNSYGIDLLGIFTVRNILRKYIESMEIPRNGHWIV